MNDQIYNDYWQSGAHLTKEWTDEFFQESLGVLAGKRQVLDYGCGMGYSYQRQLKGAVKKYVGADVSDYAIANAKKNGLEAVKIGDNGTILIADASCDGAVCSEVFEHLWDPLAAAKELNRILEPNGVLVATVPNFGYLAWRLLALLRAQVPAEPESKHNRYKGVHIRFYSALMLTRLLKDAGFRSVKIYGWCGGSIWDVFRCAGPLGHIGDFANKNLSSAFRLSFMSRVWPNVFAERLRAVAVK